MTLAGSPLTGENEGKLPLADPRDLSVHLNTIMPEVNEKKKIKNNKRL